MKMTEKVSLAEEMIRKKAASHHVSHGNALYCRLHGPERERELVLMIIFTLENILRSP